MISLKLPGLVLTLYVNVGFINSLFDITGEVMCSSAKTEEPLSAEITSRVDVNCDKLEEEKDDHQHGHKHKQDKHEHEKRDHVKRDHEKHDHEKHDHDRDDDDKEIETTAFKMADSLCCKRTSDKKYSVARCSASQPAAGNKQFLLVFVTK